MSVGRRRRGVRVLDHLDDDILCCCEFINMNGERTHMLQMCCDCEALDHLCDRVLCCKGLPSTEGLERLAAVIDDRVRIPGLLGGGAGKVPWGKVLPVLMVFITHVLAARSLTCTVVAIAGSPVLLWLWYRHHVRHSSKRRTPVLYHWALASSVAMWIIFQTCVFTLREVLLYENLMLTTMFMLMLVFLYWAKQDPGVIPSPRRHKLKVSDVGVLTSSAEDQADRGTREFSEHEVTWVDSRPIRDGRLVTMCDECGVRRPPRSGHCTICQACVSLRDHHCVWIDNCVGENNHVWFVLALGLYITCGVYGSHMTLTSVCTPILLWDNFLWPDDCRFIYHNTQLALAFSSALYTLAVCAVMMVALLQQLLLVSQNLTSQEHHTAVVRGQAAWWGLIARNNVNNHGFWRNWRDFWNNRRTKAYNDTSSLP